jgi:hypothetical protein
LNTKRIWALIGLVVIFSLLTVACQPQVVYVPQAQAPAPQPQVIVVAPPDVQQQQQQQVIIEAPAPVEPQVIVVPAEPLDPIVVPNVPGIWEPCEGLPSSRLTTGMKAYVSYDPDECNVIRSGPGKKAEWMGCIDPGTSLEIVDGPSCDFSNELVYWQVRILSQTGLHNMIFWTAEGDWNAWWLVPTD